MCYILTMKKSQKIVLILVLAAALPILILGTRLLIVSSEFSAHPSGEVQSGLFAVRDGNVNLYILEKNGKYAVVDAGTNLKNVKEIFVSLGIDPALVTVVLLTHSDFDHTGSVPLFTNAAVYLSEAEERMINGAVARFPFIHNRLNTPYQLLKDGETVTLDQWQIHTQVVTGHTVGSAYYTIDGRYLFVGDTALKDGQLHPFTSLFSMNRPEQQANLATLRMDEGVELILTGHHGIERRLQ